MALHGPCLCPGDTKTNRINWRVRDRKVSYSLRNNYRKTESKTSSVRCIECNRLWRTPAKYTDQLPDESTDEFAKDIAPDWSPR